MNNGSTPQINQEAVKSVNIFLDNKLIINITMQKLINLFDCLSALDGSNKVIQETTTDKVIKIPYNFTGKVRMVIAHNIAKLQNTIAIYQKARNDLVMQMSEGSGNVPPEKIAQFQIQNLEMLEQVYPLSLRKFKFEDLNLDNNPIPGTVVAGLEPLIQDMDGESE